MFLEAEAARDRPTLDAIAEILEGILTGPVASMQVVEVLLTNQRFLTVAGICECTLTQSRRDAHEPRADLLVVRVDSAGQATRPRHRAFLVERARLVRVLGFDTDGLAELAHHLYRIEFLRDTLLPRFPDDIFVQIADRVASNLRADILVRVLDHPRIVEELCVVLIHV